MKLKRFLFITLIFSSMSFLSFKLENYFEEIGIKIIDDIPVFFENGIPYFTRFQHTDHIIIDLSGTWKFKPDPNEQGEKEKWFSPAFDDSGWLEQKVPGCWNLLSPQLLSYQGAGWYRHWFFVPENLSKSFNRLVLDGVAYRAKVYLNGKLIGTHSGGFSRWSLDITDYLNYGAKNLLTICVDNRREFTSLPPLTKRGGPLGWWFYGGINRLVQIESSPKTTICKLAVETDHLGNIRAKGIIFSRNRSDDQVKVIIQLKDLKGRLIKKLFSKQISIAKNGFGTFELANKINGVAPWSPSTPENRYLFEITLQGKSGAEKQALELGFRKFEFKNGKAFLNHKEIFLRGINRHEDAPETGFYQTDERLHQDMALLKELKINFMRPAHYPNDPRWLDACDRAGILIAEEIPLYQVGISPSSYFASLSKKLFIDSARQLIETIERDRNHPCLVIWSVGNENLTAFYAIKHLLKKLYATAKFVDPTRPTTFALLRFPPFLEKSAGIADVIFTNEYFGWYNGKVEDLDRYLDLLHKKFPEKPIMVSEFGAGAVIGKSPEKLYSLGSVKRDFTEEYQAYFHQKQFEIILSKPYVVGTMPWIFADFRDDKRPHNPIVNFNLKGLVNYQRQKKKAFEVVSRIYHQIEKSGN